MFRRVATLLAVASATVAIGLAAPDAHADPQTDDLKFLNIVRSNGVAEGENDTLIAYAHDFCSSTTGVLPLRRVLYEQGVRLAAEFYTIRFAASRVYCPDKVVMPPAMPPAP